MEDDMHVAYSIYLKIKLHLEKIGNFRNQTKLTSELKTGQDTIITTSTQLTPMSEVTIQTTAQLKM